MRKLLYAFVFASILVLAGFTSFARPNEPGDGGTLPDEGYQVWLPMVGKELPWYEVYECSYLAHPILPSDGAVVSVNEPLMITFSYEEYPNAWGIIGWFFVANPMEDHIGLVAGHESPVITTLAAYQLPPPGTYEWHISPVCWGSWLPWGPKAPPPITRIITFQ